MTIASAAFLGLSVRVGATAGYFPLPTFYAVSLIFLAFVTSVIFFYLSKDKFRNFFLQLYLASMVVKLLAYCAYNLVMVLKDKPGALANVTFFMLAYLVFTGLEIGFLYAKISRVTKP